jgi:uncharacterized membrane protein YqgA involved in biofilm formation
VLLLLFFTVKRVLPLVAPIASVWDAFSRVTIASKYGVGLTVIDALAVPFVPTPALSCSVPLVPNSCMP